jgi:hypothetical protein
MPKLADAYLTDGRINVAVPSGPGRYLRFVARKAEIHNETDLVSALKLENVEIAIGPNGIDRLERCLLQCGPRNLKAKVTLPEGYRLAKDLKVVKAKTWKKVVVGESAA